ncbi:MAG: BTAD domain-containing putative transcriptional regulator [Acidimicrobiia bacterium]
MRVQLLGPVEAYADDGEVLSIGGPKQRTVLALLCVDPGRPVSSDRLIEGVWGDEVPERSARSLSTYVSNLRRALGEVVRGDHGTYRATLDRSCVDVAAFEDQVRRGDASASRDPREAARIYRDAIDMWVGTPFGGVDAHGLLTAEITRLEDLKLLIAERSLTIEIEAGGHRAAIAELESLVARYPHRDDLRGLHMRVLYLSGRQTDALASYRTYRERLVADLGLDPSPELQDLELQILTHDDALAPVNPVPESVVVASALPRRYSSFVGRTDEVSTTLSRLEDHRVVTVVGPGGIGKSSIALQVARALSEISDMTIVYAAIERVGDIATGVARAIGLAPRADVDPVGVIVGYLETRPHLLLLDGCEAHLRDTAALVHRVLSSTQSKVLATSREPLGLNGESTVRVDGLPIDDAVVVFCDRAELGKAVDDATRETVRSVCEELDGLPLAIELLAARAGSTSLDRLASRLGSQITLLRRARSFDDRHGSLLAALDWSYDLLTEAEQRTLRAASVFVAPFTMKDAVAVLDRPYVEDEIDRLVHVSLLQPPTSRGEYRFLEPIRQYAAYRLAESGEREAIGSSHAEWIAVVAEGVDLDRMSLTPYGIVDWIFEKRDEMLAGIDWAMRHDEPDTVIRIVASVGRVVVAAGVHGPWLARVLAGLEHPRVTRNGAWAIAASRAAWMLTIDGRRDAGIKLLERAEAVAASIGDPLALWMVKQRQLVLMGWTKSGEHQLELMQELDQQLPAARGVDVQAFSHNKAIVFVFLERFDEAEATMREQRERWGERVSVFSWSYDAVMSSLEAYRGELESSLHIAMESALAAERDHVFRFAQGVWERVGALADRVGDAKLLEEAMEHHRHIEAITGASPSILLEIRAALAAARYDKVLELAATWFDELVGDPIVDVDSHDVDDELMIYGDVTQMPRIFAILRPVARALHSVGRTGEACRLVRAVPALMAESRFAYWDEFREWSLWEPLVTECGSTASEPMTLPEVYETVRTMVSAAPGTALAPALSARVPPASNR